MQNIFMKYKKQLFCLVVILSILPLTGCAKKNFWSFLGMSTQTEAASVESLAMEGLDYFERGRYYKARVTFEKLLSLYPFSEYSLLAELKVADSNFYLKRYEEAVLQYADFEKRHPTNEAIPYVLFQTAMCYYNQIDTIDRDAANANNAIYSFTRLLSAFPDSPYEDEARARVKAARNFLAHHEYYVASFYERTGSYGEAEARLEYLLKNYPESAVSGKAEELLQDLQNNNPPGRSMFGWLPKRQPDWEDLSPEGE
jgi:outer membrane protein assembly factor BamD